MKKQSVNVAHTDEYEKMFREMCKTDNLKSEFPKTEEEAKDHTLCIVKELVLPDGYEFQDENGNVIEAKKIVLEKKKPKYPETYEECCKEMKCAPWFEMNTCYHGNELSHLYRLLICRDAYWKLAGDWKPDWAMYSGPKHCIIYSDNQIKWQGKCFVTEAKVLAFPTEEMRDIFYENFKQLIEECKELI